MLMKQHSYAFYNGYLSEALKSKNHLETHLKQLQDTKPVKSPSGNRPAVSSFTTSYLDHQPTASELNHRRHHNEVDEIQERSSDIAQIAAAIETDEPLDLEQIQLFERILKWEINVLSENLKGRASKASAHYPNNLTMANHFEFIVLPTLVSDISCFV
jgi:sterol O-acyltransferase